MKHKTQTIVPSQPLEMTIDLGIENNPEFTITGTYEDIMPMAEQLEARQTRREVAPERVASRVGQTLIEQPKRLVEGVFGRLAVDLRAKRYDLQNGTHFLAAVREKRQLEKDLRFAQELGLLTVDVCAKHRKAIESVKKVR